jgi:outer membrane lipoprotein-sorting protein
MGEKIVFTAFTCSIFTGVIICLVLSAGCTSTSTPENLTAAQVAEKFVHQQDTIRDLEATIEIPTEFSQHKDLFLMQKKNPYSYRIEYLLSGSEVNGTLVMTNGNVIWWYSPLTKSVHTTTHFDPNETYLSQRDYQKIIQGLFENYPHAYHLDRFDGVNNSYVIVFSALPGEPFRDLPYEYQNARVWIDAGSWIAQRIEFYNADWPSPMTVEYRDVRINSGIPDTMFVFDSQNVPHPPPDESWHFPSGDMYFSLEEAYREEGSDLVVVTSVPAGYSYDSGASSWDGKTVLTMGNGTQWIKFIHSPVVGEPIYDSLEGEYVEVAINGTTGTFRQGPEKNQLQWNEGRDSYWIIGKMDQREMITMATSLAPMNDQLLAILPWNKPKTAQPLTVAELTSIIMPESWILSHNTSTTPGIIDIRMTAREFHEMFVPSLKYPAFLVYINTSPHERVALYQLPTTMFAANNPDPSEVRLNHPESMFRYYPDLDAVWADRCNYGQMPCADGGVTPVE